MKIYLDNCCYNRPFDDQRQDRIHMESEAVLAVIKRGRIGVDTILGSAVLALEMSKLKDIGKKEKYETPDTPIDELAAQLKAMA